MRRIHEIITPENVIIKYELAGLGSRFAAMLLDLLIQGGLLLIVVIAISLIGFNPEITDIKGIFYALGIIALFLITTGYFVFFEMIMDGQTPGKKAVGLKVMKITGEPLGFMDSLLRNVLRTADMLPGTYLAGALFILFTKKYRRIGDFVANTAVVKVKGNKELQSFLNIGASALYTFEENVNIFPVSNFEYEILKEFLQRNGSLGARRQVFIYHLNRYFMERFNLHQPMYSDPVAFFDAIVRMNSTT